MTFKPTIKSWNRRRLGESGNAILMLFAAIGMAGVVTFGLNNILRGPALTASEVSRRTIAENQLMATSQMAVASAVRSQANKGDCDRDGFVEPMPFRPRGAVPAPVGGGLVPMTIGASLNDPWGAQYGYCVWDPGTRTRSDNIAACGGSAANRLNGSPKDNQPALAIVSAGKNGAFETGCAAYVDTTPADGIPDAAMLNKPAGSDDVVLSYTYAEANGIGSGEWKISAADPTTAEVAKDLKVGGGASFTGALDVTKGGLTLPQDPGDNTITGVCAASKDGQMRINTSGNPPSIEICNMAAGGAWMAVSGSGSMPEYPSCLFPPPVKVGGIPATGGSHNAVYNGSAFTTQNSGGSGCYITSYSKTDPPTNFTMLQDINNCNPPVSNDAQWIMDNGYMYFASPNNNFVIYNVTNPSGMVLAGSVTDATKLSNGASIAKLDATHYVVSAPSLNRVTVIDVTNPAAPAVAGSVLDATRLSSIADLAVSGSYAYVGAGNKLTVVNLTNPAAPVITGSVTSTDMNDTIAVASFGNYALTLDIYNSKLVTVDVTNPAAPVVANVLSLTGITTGDYPDMRVFGKYLFIIGSAKSLAIYDLSDPVKPLLVRNLLNASYLPDVVNDISMDGKYLYVSGGTNGDNLTVLNLGCDPLTGEIDTSMITENKPVIQPDRLDSNMLARWTFDAGTGTTAADSAAGNTGTFVNTPVWALGPNGSNSLIFNKADRDAVQIASLLGSPRVGTVSLWVNAQSTDNGNASTANSAGDGSYVFSLGDYIRLRVGKASGVELSFWNGSAYIFSKAPEDVVGTGWRYITATWDDNNDLFRVYIDGVLQADLTSAAAMVFTGKSPNTYLGRWNTDVDFDFDGGMDDVRVFDRALGANEIAQLYARMKANSKVRQLSHAGGVNAYNQSRVVTGISSACAIKPDNSLWCWGDDAVGSLGNGASVGSTTEPYRVDSNAYIDVSGRQYTFCAIRMDGTLWCWGANATGQTGSGTSGTNQQSPVMVNTPGKWSQVSVGIDYACGVKSDSSLWCWGDDINGTLGNGASTTQQNAPQQIAASGWSSVYTRLSHTCGIKTDGTAWCWGQESYGELGDGGTNTNRVSPNQVADPGPWMSLALGQNATCGLKVDGTLWCWGQDTNGLLGNTNVLTVSDVQQAPKLVSGAMRFSAVAMGGVSACALTTDGRLFCWGSDANGKLGNGTTLTADQVSPYPVDDSMGWTSVAVAANNACGFKSDGTLWCWGSDGSGQLGNGAVLIANQESPSLVADFVDPPMMDWDDSFTIIAATPNYNMAIYSGMLGGGGGSFGFGFSAPGKSVLIQPLDSNQLLLETATTNASSQISFKTAPNTAAADYTTALAVKWMLDDSSGTAVVSSPGAQTATLSGPVWNPGYGRNAGSLYFDGIDDYAAVPASATLAPTNITLAMWVKFGGTQSGLNAKIISKAWNGHTYPTFNSYSLTTGWGNEITFETGHSGTAHIIKTADLDPLKWNYIVAVYEPGGAAPQKRLYINGALKASATQTAALVYDNTATTGRLLLGMAGLNGEYFKGQIDDVRIYSAGLTTAQVAQLYSYQTSLFQTPRSMGIDYSTNLFSIGRNNAAASNWLNAITPDVAVTAGGLLGVGTATPQAFVDVAGGVRFGPDYECYTASHTGKVRYVQGATPPYQYCNGTSWTNFPTASNTKWRKGTDTFSAGESSTCGIKADGSAWCWGSAAAGRIGDNQTATNRLVPTRVHDSASATGWNDWVQINVGDDHVVGLRSNGTAWAWGSGAQGTLGNGATANQSRPVQIKDNTNTTFWTDWIQVDAHEIQSCGLRANGTAWCWGEDYSGSMGNGSATGDRNVPTAVVTDTGSGQWTDWVQISTGFDHNCGIRADGSAWCWGDPYRGELGNNDSATNRVSPTRVWDTASSTGFFDWVQIAAGAYNTCGIRATGEMYCWGEGTTAKIGDGQATTHRLRPTLVSGGYTDWKYVSTGYGVSCAIRANGTLWCWGLPPAGETGTNGYAQRTVPTQVLQSSCSGYWSDWVSVSADFEHVCGVRTDGSAWCWGSEAAGQLGNNGNSTDRLCPVAVQ